MSNANPSRKEDLLNSASKGGDADLTSGSDIIVAIKGGNMRGSGGRRRGREEFKSVALEDRKSYNSNTITLAWAIINDGCL